MASKYYFETRDERIERMYRDNPGRPIELCTAVVDGIWDDKRRAVQSKIPERFVDASMADLGYPTEEIMMAVQKIFDPPSKNDKVGIIFYGPAGSGKTHAVYAVIKMILEKNPEMIAHIANYSQTFSELKGEFANGSYEEMSSTWDKLNNDSGLYDGLLVLDDISSQKLTDFEADKMMMILENRVNSYMPFIFTTNVKVSDFKAVFGERIASRLFGYCELIPFKELDKRIESEEPHEE